MPVVSVQPDRQRSGAVIRGWVGLSVGPFAQGGLDEALGLAVRLGRIRLGPDVLETELAAGRAEGLRAIAGAIVGHHTGNRDAEVRVVGDRRREEGDRALLFLVGDAALPGSLRHPVSGRDPQEGDDDDRDDSFGRGWFGPGWADVAQTQARCGPAPAAG